MASGTGRGPPAPSRSEKTPADASRQLLKSNSTTTLFVDSTLAQGDLGETLRCMAVQIAGQVERASSQGTAAPPAGCIFSESLHPMRTYFPRSLDEPVTPETVFKFLEGVFRMVELSVACAIIATIYVERFLKCTSTRLSRDNWMRIALGATLLASKVWDDNAVWNLDYCEILPDLAIGEMNELEKHFMHGVQYNVSIRASAYAECFFKLRQHSTPAAAAQLASAAADETLLSANMRARLESLRVDPSWARLADGGSRDPSSLLQVPQGDPSFSTPTTGTPAGGSFGRVCDVPISSATRRDFSSVQNDAFPRSRSDHVVAARPGGRRDVGVDKRAPAC